MRIVRGGHFWQFSSITSLATVETTDGQILVAFFGPNMASEAISERKNFPGGACPQTPLPCSQ